MRRRLQAEQEQLEEDEVLSFGLGGDKPEPGHEANSRPQITNLDRRSNSHAHTTMSTLSRLPYHFSHTHAFFGLTLFSEEHRYRTYRQTFKPDFVPLPAIFTFLRVFTDPFAFILRPTLGPGVLQ